MLTASKLFLMAIEVQQNITRDNIFQSASMLLSMLADWKILAET